MIANIKKKISIALKNLKNKKKVKFVILCSARTGSSYLVSLINSLPEVKTYGELFNLNSIDKDELNELLNDPIKYLRMKFKIALKKNKAVGFKIFYYHTTKKGFGKNNPHLVRIATKSLKKKVLDFEAYVKHNYDIRNLVKKLSKVFPHLKMNDYRIIHLKRKNLLRSYISLKKAYLTDNWMSKKSKTKKVEKISLDYKECLAYFKLMKKYELKYDLMFKNHKKIVVYYENLVDNKIFELARIQKFLSLPIKNCSSFLNKQENKPLIEIISNYHQLRKKFLNTKWIVYFDN